MKNTRLSLLAAAAFAISTSAIAAPIVNIGATISNPDVSLNFDAITPYQNLSVYQENGIAVSLNGNAYLGFYAFSGYNTSYTGFYYAAGGSESYLSIKGVNKEVFSGAGFLLGNGWTTNNNFVTYETYLNGMLSGQGSFQAPNGLVSFVDSNGFDELRVNANSFKFSSLDQYQAIAIDDLNLDIKDAVSAVPEPSSLALLGLGVMGLMSTRRRKSL